MPPADAKLDLIRRIHAAPSRAVIAVTGGGGLALGDLLAVPGASQTVLEAIVPYSTAAQIEFLGSRPEQFVSAPTARAMAMAAYRRAVKLNQADDPSASRERERPVSSDAASSNDTAAAAAPSSGLRPPSPQGEKGANLVGVGLTGSLASDRPKRGPHRVHVAAQSDSCTWSCSLELTKGARSRAEEEAVAAALLLDLLAEACGLADRPPIELLAGETIERRRTDALPGWIELFAGRSSRTCERPDFPGCTGEPRAIFPGSFRPLHDGHRRMAAVASEVLGCPVEFELSIENVEKPPLDFEEMQWRGAQFDAATRIWYTRAPRMVQKAALFPGATIVCGLDTIVRVADARFADDSETEKERIIAEIARHGCRFLVFGRTTDGKFQTLDDVEIPESLRRIATGVPESKFRADVSSTELRKRSS